MFLIIKREQFSHIFGCDFGVVSLGLMIYCNGFSRSFISMFSKNLLVYK